MPDPVGPQTATISPGSSARSRSQRTSCSPPYAKRTASKRTGSGPAGSGFGYAGSGSGGIPSSHAKLRPAEASARCARFVIQPSASSGHTSWRSSVSKRTNWPIERWPRDHLPPAEVDDRRDRERRQVVEPGQVARLDAGLAEHGAAHRLGALAEAAAHVVLAAERLHHLDPDDGLVGGLRHVALALLHLARERRDAPCEAERERRDRRHRDRGVQREPRVDDHEHDAGADDHHHALHPLHEPPADEVADRVEVVRRAREHLAGRVPVEERARVAEVRAVEQLAHPRLDPDADARGRVAAREVDPEAERSRARRSRATYGQSGRVWWTIASSIARCMSSGIAIEISA